MKRLLLRIAVNARRNQREGDRLTAALLRELERPAVAGDELLALAVLAAAPHRADRVDYIFAGQIIRARDLRITGIAAAEQTALVKKPRPGRAVYAAVHAAASEQRAVGGVHNRVHIHLRYIAAHNFKRHYIIPPKISILPAAREKQPKDQNPRARDEPQVGGVNPQRPEKRTWQRQPVDDAAVDEPVREISRRARGKQRKRRAKPSAVISAQSARESKKHNGKDGGVHQRRGLRSALAEQSKRNALVERQRASRREREAFDRRVRRVKQESEKYIKAPSLRQMSRSSPRPSKSAARTEFIAPRAISMV